VFEKEYKKLPEHIIRMIANEVGIPNLGRTGEIRPWKYCTDLFTAADKKSWEDQWLDVVGDR
jgi:hypothetical protein